MNDEEKHFINIRSPYVLFNVGYYLMSKKEYVEKCKTKSGEKPQIYSVKNHKYMISNKLNKEYIKECSIQ